MQEIEQRAAEGNPSWAKGRSVTIDNLHFDASLCLTPAEDGVTQ